MCPKDCKLRCAEPNCHNNCVNYNIDLVVQNWERGIVKKAKAEEQDLNRLNHNHRIQRKLFKFKLI